MIYLSIVQGEEYVSIRTEQTVGAKTFQNITSCCPKKCFSKVDTEHQKNLHKRFWEIGDYAAQNVFLSTVMKKMVKWIYLLPHQFERNEEFVVCQQFLLNIFSIGRARLRTVQEKVKNNQTIYDNRGKHTHFAKLTRDLKRIIYQHCESLSHKTSHYTNSQLKYFKDSSLTLKSLYKLFLDFYKAKTGDNEIPLAENTYFDYFNHFVDFSFEIPRTDCCNECYENEKLGKQNEPAAQKHKQQVFQHEKIKKSMLLTAKDNNLCLEFDFGQNLPLPKLPVNAQFYLRLIWLHIFNVHVHVADKEKSRSYMYLFMEGFLKKGGNTVFNYLWHAILEEFKLNMYNSIFLFSDSCGGQNKNYNMIVFLSLLSQKLQVTICHLYPIRGHSYCECDRNFGL